MLTQISVRNLTGSPLILTRIGLTISASSTLLISTYAYEHEIRGDESLLSAIQANSAVFLFDGVTLSKGESLRYMSANAEPPGMSVDVASDVNVSSLSGTGSTIDGQVIAAENIILLTSQTVQSENGPWVANAGAWTRPPAFPSGSSISGASFLTLAGTVYDNKTWLCDTPRGSDIIDTDNLFFFQRTSSSSDPLSVGKCRKIILRGNIDYGGFSVGNSIII